MLRNINMIRIRFINQSFIELRKLILNSIYNNNSLKLNNEINKRIIERFDNILDYKQLYILEVAMYLKEIKNNK
jgi:hypothetical protein